MSLEPFLVIVLGLGAGAICKGITGMGLPLLALPLLANFFALPDAIAIILVPAAASNLWQSWAFRANRAAVPYLPAMLIVSGFGIALGTVFLKTSPGDVLSLTLGLLLIGYIGLRLLHPSFVLALDAAARLSLPVSFSAGLMQGAVGIAAPIIATFFNALRLERDAFLFSIAAFYLSISVFQLTALGVSGLLDRTDIVYGLFALVPVAVFMPIGNRLGRFVKPKTFDHIVLALLFLMGLRFILRAI